MRLGVLASGSRGNALVIEHEGCMVFFDAGLSGKKHTERLLAAGFGGLFPEALFISHEHSDHIKGAGVLARKWNIPVYGSSGTLGASRRSLGKLPDTGILENGTGVDFRSFTVSAFSIAHDATDPSGYVIEWDSGKLGIATDLGKSSPLVEASLKGCSALILEFNHDEDMLWNGSYPWHLKQRIASTTGHLSNSMASDLLGAVYHRDLKVCVLAHLSQENNSPHLAENASREVAGGTVRIHTGMQDTPLPAMDL
ncbi:MAG: MBL fold metallo-hydrolase [Candidatus Aegiribacteria sp.]|nr:MBL fold metallo-hydrolase [Candidatus Aegiribacteria sp.]